MQSLRKCSAYAEFGMTRCCIKHCKGSCHSQKGRVERGGKSVFLGHCASAARCEAAMSREALLEAADLFCERCKAADKRRGHCRDNGGDEYENEDEDECEDGCRFTMLTRDLRWDVDCNNCSTTAIQGSGFYHSDELRLDVCERCWSERRGTPHTDKLFVYWTWMSDPYGGNALAVWVPKGYFGPCTYTGEPCENSETSESSDTTETIETCETSDDD